MVSLQKLGRVYVLTLSGDDEHRFVGVSMGRIIAALQTVHDDPDVGALVTTNEGKFYSNGLDLNWVRENIDKKNDKPSIFGRLLATMLSLNVPTIAAICGHACAAGFIFALAHDHRYMRNDRGFLYMNEMDVKVRIPIGSMNVIRSALSPKAFKDTCLLVKKHTASEAYALGIVDSVHENAAATLEAAIKLATELSQRNWDRKFYRNFRLDMKPGLIDSLLNVELQQYVMHRSKI